MRGIFLWRLVYLLFFQYNYIFCISKSTFMNYTKEISQLEKNELLIILKKRFEKNMHRHPKTIWENVVAKLEENPAKFWSINEMETTGGEPDVIEFENSISFFDCSPESPKGRRSLCYDGDALESRKEHKPQNSVTELANSMGIDLLNEAQYRFLQSFGALDTKTSSWVKTPDNIRKLGGAIFGDFRYGQVFIYHNGAESYYAARGFRGMISL
ncbi:MAG: hypothetical protein RLZZ175_785 [Bacteroidota bacterium]|jgi:hypothetical protein